MHKTAHTSLQLSKISQKKHTYGLEAEQYQCPQNVLLITILFFSLLLLPSFLNSALCSLFLFALPFHPFQPKHSLFNESSPRPSGWGCWSFLYTLVCIPLCWTYTTLQSSVYVSGNPPIRLLTSFRERLFITCLCTPSAWHLVGVQLVSDTSINECKNKWRDLLTEIQYSAKID